MYVNSTLCNHEIVRHSTQRRHSEVKNILIQSSGLPVSSEGLGALLPRHCSCGRGH